MPAHVVCLRAYTSQATPGTVQMCPRADAARPRTAAPSSHGRLLSPRHPRSPLAETDEERSVNALNVPGPDRRGSLTARSGMAAAAAGLTASDAQAATAAPGSSLTEAVLAAFQTHRVVAIGDAHAGQEIHDLLLTILSDPRLYGTANDIVVEFGDAFYQDTLDKFILGRRARRRRLAAPDPAQYHPVPEHRPGLPGLRAGLPQGPGGGLDLARRQEDPCAGRRAAVRLVHGYPRQPDPLPAAGPPPGVAGRAIAGQRAAGCC